MAANTEVGKTKEKETKLLMVMNVVAEVQKIVLYFNPFVNKAFISIILSVVYTRYAAIFELSI